MTPQGPAYTRDGRVRIDESGTLRTLSGDPILDAGGAPILEFTRDGVVQGAVEGSNVDPVREMTRLIDVTRAFDGVAAEASQSEASLQEAIKTLGSSA